MLFRSAPKSSLTPTAAPTPVPTPAPSIVPTVAPTAVFTAASTIPRNVLAPPGSVLKLPKVEDITSMSTKDLEGIVVRGDTEEVIKVINQKLAIRNLTSADRQNLENQKKLLEETKARMIEYDPWLGAILEAQQHAGK